MPTSYPSSAGCTGEESEWLWWKVVQRCTVLYSVLSCVHVIRHGPPPPHILLLLLSSADTVSAATAVVMGTQYQYHHHAQLSDNLWLIFFFIVNSSPWKKRGVKVTTVCSVHDIWLSEPFLWLYLLTKVKLGGEGVQGLVSSRRHAQKWTTDNFCNQKWSVKYPGQKRIVAVCCGCPTFLLDEENKNVYEQ